MDINQVQALINAILISVDHSDMRVRIDRESGRSGEIIIENRETSDHVLGITYNFNPSRFQLIADLAVFGYGENLSRTFEGQGYLDRRLAILDIQIFIEQKIAV